MSAIAIALAGACLALVPATLAQETNNIESVGILQQATVFLMQTYNVEGTQVLSCVGSGTLISTDGLILTNAHLATAEGSCRGDRIVVALPTRLNEPPVPTYIASVVQIDVRMDLAVLQISGGLDGNPIRPNDLNLPFAQIGDPSPLLPGNTLTYVGYPDISNSNVAGITGQISGITAEKNGSRQAWLRTSAQLGGGMSGGGAYDSNGLLIGVLTSAPPTDGTSPGPTCLSIQDNNHDGQITEQDACVPIGAPVTQIRPITFAAPLIESAKSGFVVDRKIGFPGAPTSGQPTFSRLFFSTQIDALGIATKIVSAAPSGTTSLFLHFDYQNMRQGLPYELKVTLNGLAMPQLSLGPLAWGGESQGTWYIGTENVGWPDGTYEFTLLLNGQPAAAQSITLGGSPTEPTFSNLAFGLPNSSSGSVNPGTLFPAQVQQVDAQFDFDGIQEGQDWTEVWLLDGSEVSRQTRVWDGPTTGHTSVSATNFAGLPLGNYRLELYIGQRLAATGDISLVGNKTQANIPAVFNNARIAADIARDGTPQGQTGSVLPLGTTAIYAFVDWDFIPTGLLWTFRWILDGRIVASSTQPWDAGGVGQDYWMSLTSPEPLPEGAYAVDVLVADQPMFSANVSIGSGTQPQSGLQSPSDEVFVSGMVVDAVTGQSISGAMVFVLDVALESPQFSWDEKEIHTQAITDENGRFAFPRGLPRGNYYTVYSMAEGYITVVEDNFIVLKSQPSPVEITIEMSPPD